jgi:WD40 repeat protein
MIRLRSEPGVEGKSSSIDRNLHRNGCRFIYPGHASLTAPSGQKVKLWDTATGEEVFTLRGHTSGVICVAFSPDGRRIASTSWDRTVRVWDTSPPASHDLFRRGAESLGKPPELPADPFASGR